MSHKSLQLMMSLACVGINVCSRISSWSSFQSSKSALPNMESYNVLDYPLISLSKPVCLFFRHWGSYSLEDYMGRLEEVIVWKTNWEGHYACLFVNMLSSICFTSFKPSMQIQQLYSIRTWIWLAALKYSNLFLICFHKKTFQSSA